MAMLNVYAVIPKDASIKNIADLHSKHGNFKGVTDPLLLEFFKAKINRDEATGLEIPRDNDPTGFVAGIYSEWLKRNFQFDLFKDHDPTEIAELFKQMAFWLESSPPQRISLGNDVARPISSFYALSNFMRICLWKNLWWEADF